MPRRTTYVLRWLPEIQTYTITANGLPLADNVIPEGHGWHDWLDDIHSFSFTSRSGEHYTVRKEKMRRGTSYWYGYRSLAGRTIKRYIGKTENLTISQLEKIATSLTDETIIDPVRQDAPAKGSLLPTPAPTLEPLQIHLMPLLESKLHAPRLSTSLVIRPQLFARFDTALSHKLTLLSTPAGFGKTTAVSQWLAERSTQLPQEAGTTRLLGTAPNSIYRSAAWVALDEGDNDPVRFWRYIIAACQTWHTGLGRTALALLSTALRPPFELPSGETMLTLLLNDIAHHVQGGLLILEDYHVITEPLIHDMLTFFIDHLPGGLCVMMLTRSEPPLPLLRWRARGEMQDIRTADLRFSQEEAAIFFQQATLSPFSPTLSDETIKHFATYMEGWAAGLRLLLLTLQGQTGQRKLEQHLATLVDTSHCYNHQLTHSQQAVVEYFVTEVLNAQPEPLQLFLLQTSMLNRLTGSLCDTVTGGKDGAAQLAAVERAGLFLEALDGPPDYPARWYRYHALFAEAMRREAMARLGEERLYELTQRASNWYEQHNMLAEAIEATLHIQDVERAAVLIEQICEPLNFYELHTLLHWLELLPETVLRQHPALCFHSAMAMLFTPHDQTIRFHVTARMKEILQMAEDSWRDSNDLARLGEVFACRAMLFWLHESIGFAVEYARQALELLPVEQPDHQYNAHRQERSQKMEWRSMCLTIIGMEVMGEGSLDNAKKTLLEAYEYSSTMGNPGFTRAINMMISSVYIAQGKLHEAASRIHQVLLEAKQENDWGDVTYGLFGLAGISYEWNDLQEIERQANESLEYGRQSADPEIRDLASFYLTLVRQKGRSEKLTTQQELTTLLAHLQTIPSLRLLPFIFEVQNWLIRLSLAIGDIPMAHRHLIALTQSEKDLTTGLRERIQILQCRFLLAQGKAQEALSLLDRLLNILQEKQRVRDALEVQVVMALAYAANRQGPAARQMLYQALSQAHSEGYVRLFLDEGEELANLLRALEPTIQEKWLRIYAQTILQAFTIQGDAVIEAEAHMLDAADGLPIEPISLQERRVLRLLMTGHTNPEIARELVVSVNTIKDHVKSLYRKLQVNNRLAASEAARRLQIF